MSDERARGTTHYEGCWQYHPQCAAAMVDVLCRTLVACKTRMFGAGPSTDPLYAKINSALSAAHFESDSR